MLDNKIEHSCSNTEIISSPYLVKSTNGISNQLNDGFKLI